MYAAIFWVIAPCSLSMNGLEKRKYGRRDPSRWPRGSFYPQKLALTSPTSGGRSVGIVRSRTQATEFSFFIYICKAVLLLVVIDIRKYTALVVRISVKCEIHESHAKFLLSFLGDRHNYWIMNAWKFWILHCHTICLILESKPWCCIAPPR
jgi:hypothetical protein